MKKFTFLLFLTLASCTRYVYIVVPTQVKEIQKPSQIYTPSYEPVLKSRQSDVLRIAPYAIDTTKYFNVVDSLFFLPNYKKQ